MDATLGCFWVELRTLTQVVHRSSMIARASLASTITSFVAGHALKGNGVWSNLTLRVSNPTTGEHTPPWQGGISYGAERRPHKISSAGSGHHNTNHIPYQGDNSQHTLRKDMAGIHTKISPHTKNTGYTRPTQGRSLIKTPLNEHSK